MAQSGYTPILIYASGTTGNTPVAANLTSSASGAELALNYFDGKLFYKDASGVVQVLATKGTGPIGGSNTQVQFNNNGALGGSASLTWDGTYLTAGSIKDSALTSGRVTYATTSGQLTDSANLLYSGTDLTVYGITVGRGAGAVSTNTAVGASALLSNVSNTNSVAIGSGSMQSATASASNSTAVGYRALFAGDGFSASTAIGSQSLYNNSSANNTAVGYQSLYGNTTGANNVAVGRGALLANTTGNDSQAIGYNALSAQTTGGANSVVGSYALSSNTTGTFNIAFGNQALNSNTTASNNTAVGYQALYTQTTPTYPNTAFGYQAGYSVTTGNGNTFIGHQAGYAVTTGSGNTFVGPSNSASSNPAGNAMTTGSSNTILGGFTGNQGGLDIRTASNYIVLSDGAGNPRAWFKNDGYNNYKNFANAYIGGVDQWITSDGTVKGALNFGSSYDQANAGDALLKVYADATYTTPKFYVASGANGVYLSWGATSWTANSDSRLKNITGEIQNGLNKVCSLRAAEFTWKSDETAKPQVGLIAQDVQAVLPEVISTSKAIKGDDTEYLGVSYTEVIPLLVAAIKELKAEVDSLKSQLKGA